MTDTKSPELLAAELRKAEADAAAAEEAARKTKAEADKLFEDLAKQREEYAEWLDDAANRTRTASAAADEKELTNDEKRLANLKTQRGWIVDAAPELKDVDRGEFTGADKSLFTSLVATRALRKAATAVANNLFPRSTTMIPGTVLFTTDDKLVDRLALHDGVLRQLKVLATQLEKTISTAPPLPDASAPPSPNESTGLESAGVVVAGAAAALGKMVPGLISLVSSKRTVTSSVVTQDAYITMLAVAGQVLSWPQPPPVLIDQTRILRGETAVETRFGEVELALDELSVSLASGSDRTDERYVAWAKGAKASLELTQAAVQALSTAAEGASVSPLMAAAAQAVFADESVSHIIVIRTAGASSEQVIDDKPLAFKDKVHIVGTTSIAFATLEAKTSRLIRSGVEVGDSSYSGTIGARFDFDN